MAKTGVKYWLRCCPLLLFILSVEARQPNIVFIMVDDMGWNDVSFHGSDQILTPNIDALAYKGVILQQYYSEAICTPARTALLTGKYPMRLGMHGMPLYNSEDRGIPLTERLLPSYLKDLGYATHLVGKWHVGMSRPEFLPTYRGYDTHYGMRGGFVDYYTYNKVESWPNGTLLFGLDLFDDDAPQVQEQRYVVDALTDRAVNIIEHHNTSQPLFLHMTHNAPHAGNTGGNLQPPLYTTVKNRHIANSDRRLYAEVVGSLDRSVGRVIRALSDKKLLDDTIIIFVSDNGAPTVGDMNNWGINLPFRGKKYTPWEGGIRVPALIWHSSIKSRVWDGMMHITDWLPTLTAVAGGKGNDIDKIDGVNQWDAITKGEDSKRKEVLLALEDSSRNVYAAYRAGDYKIVVGNLTGVSNGYYGEEFMKNIGSPPDYFPVLRSCEVSRTFEDMGMYWDFYEVLGKRMAATIKKSDGVKDEKPCLPNPLRGCLYNVRQDPSESHDIWLRASKIALILTSRLRALWSQQLRRGPTDVQSEADPANFDYIWTPWINIKKDEVDIDDQEKGNDSTDITNSTEVDTNAYNDISESQQNTNRSRFDNQVKNENKTSSDTASKSESNPTESISTKAMPVNCNVTSSSISNFLCVLRSVF